MLILLVQKALLEKFNTSKDLLFSSDINTTADISYVYMKYNLP